MTDNTKGMWDRVDFSEFSEGTTQKKIQELLIEGKAVYDAREFKKSIDLFKKCVQVDAENLEAHYYLGLIYTRLEDFNRAIIHFNEIIMSEYQYVHLEQVQCILGYIYSLQEDYETAKEYLLEIHKLNPKNIRILSIIGFIFYKQKKYEDAKEHYHKIIKIDTNNSNAFNSLGMILIESDEDIDKGLEMCKKALEISPDNPAYLDSVGWGYYLKKDDVKAMEYLKKAFEKHPESQEIKEHLKKLLDI